MQYQRGLVIFNRNLRLDDNRVLEHAATTCEQIIPVFIINPEQVGPKNNFRSNNAIQFMGESLQDLDKQLKAAGSRLYCAYGTPTTIVKKLIKHNDIDALFLHRDYTPFARARNADLAALCAEQQVAFHAVADVLLNEPGQVERNAGGPYTTFTPFFKKARERIVAKPVSFSEKSKLYSGRIPALSALSTVYKKLNITENDNVLVRGGTQQAQKKLRALKAFKTYAKQRDYPAVDTTHLSAAIKFGCVSPRQVYHAIAKALTKKHLLLQQLYWRDFFTHVAYHFPHVFGQPFREKFASLRWKNDAREFKAWCAGKTGVPIVDAGMRELVTTGWMHNRVRMIVGSFLVKDLWIDWQWGEKFFAQHLIDYDPCVNNGNWQWVASTGCDAQPYFRIFNPWLQQKKFDPECAYIKQWVPELAELTPRDIHRLQTTPVPRECGYPEPIVDHTERARRAKALYKRAA